MSDISVDEFIKKNYRPVDDKSGDQTIIDKLCVNPGYILSKEEIIKSMEEKEDE